MIITLKKCSEFTCSDDLTNINIFDSSSSGNYNQCCKNTSNSYTFDIIFSNENDLNKFSVYSDKYKIFVKDTILINKLISNKDDVNVFISAPLERFTISSQSENNKLTFNIIINPDSGKVITFTDIKELVGLMLGQYKNMSGLNDIAGENISINFNNNISPFISESTGKQHGEFCSTISQDCDPEQGLTCVSLVEFGGDICVYYEHLEYYPEITTDPLRCKGFSVCDIGISCSQNSDCISDTCEINELGEEVCVEPGGTTAGAAGTTAGAAGTTAGAAGTTAGAAGTTAGAAGTTDGSAGGNTQEGTPRTTQGSTTTEGTPRTTQGSTTPEGTPRTSRVQLLKKVLQEQHKRQPLQKQHHHQHLKILKHLKDKNIYLLY